MPEQEKRGQQQPQPYDMEQDVASVGGDAEEAREEGKAPGGDMRTAYSSDRKAGEDRPGPPGNHREEQS